MDARLSRYAYLVSLLPPGDHRRVGLAFTTRRRRIASCTPYERDGRPTPCCSPTSKPMPSRASFETLTGRPGLARLPGAPGDGTGLRRRVWPSLLQPLRTRAEWMASLQTPRRARRLGSVRGAAPGRGAGAAHRRTMSLRGMLFTDGKIGVFTHPHDETLLQNRCFIAHIIGNGTGEWQVPVGGMGALIDALVGRARGHGVDAGLHRGGRGHPSRDATPHRHLPHRRAGARRRGDTRCW